MEYCISAFFANLNSNDFSSPNYYDLTLMAKALVLAETPVDADLLRQITFIEENTDEESYFPVSVLEFMIVRNFHKPFNQEISIYGKELTITQLHYRANRVLGRLVAVVTKIAKKYSLEFQFRKSTGGGSAADSELKL